jgi:predicted transcriptional regulator
MSEKLGRKEKAALLKRVREARGDLYRKALEERKAMRAERKQVETAMTSGPLTVPAIAAASGLSTDRVLWHVTAMRKYGRTAEAGQDGDWYTYRLVDEEKEEKS